MVQKHMAISKWSNSFSFLHSLDQKCGIFLIASDFGAIITFFGAHTVNIRVIAAFTIASHYNLFIYFALFWTIIVVVTCMFSIIIVFSVHLMGTFTYWRTQTIFCVFQQVFWFTLSTFIYFAIFIAYTSAIVYHFICTWAYSFFRTSPVFSILFLFNAFSTAIETSTLPADAHIPKVEIRFLMTLDKFYESFSRFTLM